MSDLAAALREASHSELVDQLEQRELAVRLRKAGRDDLADALATGRRHPRPSSRNPCPSPSMYVSPGNSPTPSPSGSRWAVRKP
jgi:hypothetical protein